MLTYKQVKAFLTLAQSATFAEAAEKIHLSQPALSSSIKKMEEMLGGQLFSRSTRKVILSQEGKEFVPIAKRLIHDWDTAIHDMQELFAMQRGKLTVAAMPSYANSQLPPILRQFKRQWPEINITIKDVLMEEVISLVREGRAEIGFSFESDHMEGLEFQPLLDNQFIAVMPAKHPLSACEEVTWSQISEYQFVAMNRDSSVRQWIESFVGSHALSLTIVTEANQLSTLGELVKHGFGISVVPGICEPQFAQNDVACVPISGVNLSKRIGILKASRKSLSVTAQALWEQVVADTGTE